MPPCPRPRSTAADYLAFADRLQVALNPTWDAKAGAYRTSRTLFVRVNAAMLYAARQRRARRPHRRDAGRTRAPGRSCAAAHAGARRSASGRATGPRWTSRIDVAEHARALLARPEGRRGARRRVPGARPDRACRPRCSAASATASRSSRARSINRKAPPRPGQLERRPVPRRLRRQRPVAREIAVPRPADVVPRPRAQAQRRAARRTSTPATASTTAPTGPARPRTATRPASTRAWCSASCCRTTWPGAQGMKSISAAEGEIARRWQQRVLYGDWTHAGPAQLGHRPRLPPLAAAPLLGARRQRPARGRLVAAARVRHDRAGPGEIPLRPVAAPRTTGSRPSRASLLASTFYGIKNAASQQRLDPALTAARFESLAIARRRARPRLAEGGAAAARLRVRP